MDTRTSAQRSAIMRSVKSKNTKPEIAVRSAVHRMGFRFRLHRGDLPGKPDLVFAGIRRVIFVHGCFWHGHRCRYGRLPKSRTEFWGAKILRNRERDLQNVRALRKLGWQSLVVWQCQLKRPEPLATLVYKFLRSKESKPTQPKPPNSRRGYRK